MWGGMIVQIHIRDGIRGISVMQHAVKPFQKFFLRIMQSGMVFQNLFFLALV
jgi:hypothetical protein